MVSSSKKKRGKQRKAAKSEATSTEGLIVVKIDGRAFIEKTQHNKCAKLVSLGDRNATNAVKDLTGTELCRPGGTSVVQNIHGVQRYFGAPLTTPSDDGTYTFVNISIEQSGILTTVLNFLKRCEDETFHQVMGGLGKGDLISPATWIKVLSKAAELEPNCMLQITDNIGPLVRCMCDDMTRLFFQSNKHWRVGIAQFVNLLVNILKKTLDDDLQTNGMIVESLLQHKGLLRSIVQWGFWGKENRPNVLPEEHRPDIIREMGDNEMACIQLLGRGLAQLLLRDASKRKRRAVEGAPRLLESIQTIGSIPIVNEEYNPNCMVSYTAGLVRVTKVNQDKDSFVTILGLIENGCVDKGVITEMIDFGLNYTTDTDTAELICLLSNMMLLQYDNKYKSNGKISHPNDTRVAFALRTGLVEMCLVFVEKFKEFESFDIGINGKVSLFKHILAIFNLVHKVSLHQKTAKAIRSKRSSIEEKLVSLEENETITSSAKCKQILNMVWSTLSINGSYCCRCNKSLTRTEVLECNGCGRMVYCSRACQKEDWFNGHDMACKGECGKFMGQFQGRYWPITAPDNERATRKMEEVEKNITMVQLKLFLEHSETILKQANSINVPLYDCVVVFDLRKCPIKIETFKYSNEGFYGSPLGTLKDYEISRSMDNITCMYVSSFYNNGELLEDGRVPNVTMQRMFLHEWLVDPSMRKHKHRQRQKEREQSWTESEEEFHDISNICRQS